jgi:predicted ATP-dependent protease
LSALGEIPLKQSLAVTGSINQLGEVQAVGGVNEKIEGFYEVCASRGLNGKQGVIIPAANQVHLMLHKEVRAAVRKRKFSIYPALQVEDVMQLLSGMKPGSADARGCYPQQSFNYLVQKRIEKLQRLQKQYTRHGSGEVPEARSDTEK